MLSPWQRATGALAAVLLPALFLAAPLPTAAETQTRGSLAGQFLVASPDMSDPRFARAVILMVRHDKDGAFGIVINKPVEERPLRALLDILGETGASVEGSVRIHLGGPVQLELGFVIHSAEYQLPETVVIDRRLVMTASRDIIRDIAYGKGPQKAFVAFGYSGWASGQLEGEMARRVWSTAPADPRLVFDEARDKVWDAAHAGRTQDL
jgi:putative transcriptional regulator